MCFSGTGVVVPTALYGPGDQDSPIWFNNYLGCGGSEESLTECPYFRPSHTQYCGHYEDVAVVCDISSGESALSEGLLPVTGVSFK